MSSVWGKLACHSVLKDAKEQSHSASLASELTNVLTAEGEEEMARNEKFMRFVWIRKVATWKQSALLTNYSFLANLCFLKIYLFT